MTHAADTPLDPVLDGGARPSAGVPDPGVDAATVEPMVTDASAEPAPLAAIPDAASTDAASADAAVMEIPAAEAVVADALATYTAALAELRGQVERFHDRAQAQEQVIERMQERIEDLQADQVRALLGPVATELATLHGELSEIAGRDPATMTAEQLAKEVGMLVHRVESGLELLGMETVGAAPGVAFDRRWHTATRRVPTGDPDRDGTIAAVVRQGFGAEGSTRATVMARVTIHQYDPTLAAGDASAAPTAVPPSQAPTPPAAVPLPPVAPTPTPPAAPQPNAVTAVAGPPSPAPRPPDVPLPPVPPGYHES
ncbi:nucleotide exchange factor GrpE [Modestobacter sp. VKM Ac-2984]|uniref:nucleotide exchange factor GrpE n=1 Tax=Modestobacter sp. VKM Ac-2984 TaxID=3004138 RepID=UPI0022AAD4D1|nr:nucleotide exchange factor GrpE [Modestobacter sp. VKM Ac-2984]MCZ2817259.1 nucleotide exchange factor GrpE [Modestobacter sp. VKM Ac-2984]